MSGNNMDSPEKKTTFFEEQKFRQKWLLFLLIPIFAVLIFVLFYSVYKQLILSEPFGNNPMSDIGLLVFSYFLFLFLAGLIWLFLEMKLTVFVAGTILVIKFFPFVNRKIPIQDIFQYKAVTYNPIREYGGWGIRFSIKGRGMAYNVSGNRGVDIKLKNGKRLLIGSQKPEELAAAIESVYKQI